jgi:hypothetical protein
MSRPRRIAVADDEEDLRGNERPLVASAAPRRSYSSTKRKHS